MAYDNKDPVDKNWNKPDMGKTSLPNEDPQTCVTEAEAMGDNSPPTKDAGLPWAHDLSETLINPEDRGS